MQIWRHKKTENLYKVLGKVLDCTNATEGRIMVVYTKDDTEKTFAREENEFLEKFEVIKL